MTDLDKLSALAAPVIASPNIALRVARASLEEKAAHIRGALESCEKRADGAVGPIPNACHLLIHVYREALAPLNRALMALATEGIEDVPGNQ